MKATKYYATRDDNVRQWTVECIRCRYYEKPTVALTIMRGPSWSLSYLIVRLRICHRWKYKHPRQADFFRTMKKLPPWILDWFFGGLVFRNGQRWCWFGWSKSGLNYQSGKQDPETNIKAKWRFGFEKGILCNRFLVVTRSPSLQHADPAYGQCESLDDNTDAPKVEGKTAINWNSNESTDWPDRYRDISTKVPPFRRKAGEEGQV